jgi:hypothetical protein
MNNSFDTKMRVLTTGDSHFFGFHDLSPWDDRGDYLLCLETDTPENRLATYEDVARVCIINESEASVEIVGETRAWNWQQGARLQWLRGIGPLVFGFNHETKSGFGSTILDLNSGERSVLPIPLYTAANKSPFALSVNYFRLREHYRGYSYDHPNPESSVSSAEDGIFKINLADGTVKLVLSISEVVSRLPDQYKQLGHYFTHISVSADDTHFCFLHRFKTQSGGVMTQLIVVEMETYDWKVIASDKVSHFTWVGSDCILAWCRSNAAIAKLKSFRKASYLRPLFKFSRILRNKKLRSAVYKESFRLFDITTGSSHAVGEQVLTEDGHPQSCPTNKNLIVNDTYPDKDFLQKLMVYDLSTGDCRNLAKLETQPEISETQWRCDLHPRWNPQGSKVCFDSAHSGRRQLCVMDIQG